MLVRSGPCEVASHYFKPTSKSTSLMLGRSGPCEVASHYFKLTSKLTSWMLGRSGPCEVASHYFKFTAKSTRWMQDPVKWLPGASSELPSGLAPTDSTWELLAFPTDLCTNFVPWKSLFIFIIIFQPPPPSYDRNYHKPKWWKWWTAPYTKYWENYLSLDG